MSHAHGVLGHWSHYTWLSSANPVTDVFAVIALITLVTGSCSPVCYLPAHRALHWCCLGVATHADATSSQQGVLCQ